MRWLLLVVAGCSSSLTSNGPDAAKGPDASTTCPDDQKVRLYPDADGDGFGDALAAGELVCGASTGLVTTHSDCADGDKTAHPGGDFSTTPIAGVTSGGLAFDYDCDGAETQEWTTAAPATCQSYPADECPATLGAPGLWATVIPKCGANGVWITGCAKNVPGNFCGPTGSTTKTQACK